MEISPSLLRKYFLECVVIALVVAVSTLFKLYVDMNNAIQSELKEVVLKATIVIQENNKILNNGK
jgi:hypothetical protein